MKKSGNQEIDSEYGILTSLEIAEQEHARLQEPSLSPLNGNEKRTCVILPNHIIAKDGHCSHYHACTHRDDERCRAKYEKPFLKVKEVKKCKTKK